MVPSADVYADLSESGGSLRNREKNHHDLDEFPIARHSPGAKHARTTQRAGSNRRWLRLGCRCAQDRREKGDHLMPPAKKPATRRTTRSTRTNSSSSSPISRRDVEKATAQFEKALEEASNALQSLGQDLGKGAVSAYKEVERALRTLRRDAQKTNKTLLKDLDKLMAAVPAAVSSRAGSRSSGSSSRRTTASKSGARKTSASKSKSTASKSTASKSKSTTSRSKSSGTGSRSGGGRSSSTSRSRSSRSS
jgi:hypothetical protein